MGGVIGGLPQRPGMKAPFLIVLLVLEALAWIPWQAGAAGAAGARSPTILRRFDALPGSRFSLQGQSNIHDWMAEGNLVAGFLEVGEGFPVANENASQAEPLTARVEVYVPVRNLKAVGIWEPYNEQITEIIHQRLRAEEHPKILFRLAELVPMVGGTPTASTNALCNYRATGELVIAGVTNRVSMPIRAESPEAGKLKIMGTTTLKQSDFKIIARPTGMNCFGGDPDKVRVAFEWRLRERTSTR